MEAGGKLIKTGILNFKDLPILSEMQRGIEIMQIKLKTNTEISRSLGLHYAREGKRQRTKVCIFGKEMKCHAGRDVKEILLYLRISWQR